MNIRMIEPADLSGIVKLMRNFAEFENLGEYCDITEEKLKTVMFNSGAFVEGVGAEDGGSLIGYAFFYPHFSSFRGQPGFYLEDIFVSDGSRGKGVGRLMLAKIAAIAIERGFERIDFMVLDWNTPAVDFYNNLGAERNDNERHFKISGEALTRLAG